MRCLKLNIFLCKDFFNSIDMKKIKTFEGDKYFVTKSVNDFLESINSNYDSKLTFLSVPNSNELYCCIEYWPKKKIDDAFITLLSYFVRDARESAMISKSQQDELLQLIENKYMKSYGSKKETADGK